MGADVSKILCANVGEGLSKFTEVEIKDHIVKACVNKQTPRQDRLNFTDSDKNLASP